MAYGICARKTELIALKACDVQIIWNPCIQKKRSSSMALLFLVYNHFLLSPECSGVTDCNAICILQIKYAFK